MRSQLADLVGLHADVGPVQVPVQANVVIELEVHLAAHTLNHVVPGRVRAQDQFLVRLFLRRRLRRRCLRQVILIIVTGRLLRAYVLSAGFPLWCGAFGLVKGNGRLKGPFYFFNALLAVQVLPVIACAAARRPLRELFRVDSRLVVARGNGRAV